MEDGGRRIGAKFRPGPHMNRRENRGLSAVGFISYSKYAPYSGWARIPKGAGSGYTGVVCCFFRWLFASEGENQHAPATLTTNCSTAGSRCRL